MQRPRFSPLQLPVMMSRLKRKRPGRRQLVQPDPPAVLTTFPLPLVLHRPCLNTLRFVRARHQTTRLSCQVLLLILSALRCVQTFSLPSRVA